MTETETILLLLFIVGLISTVIIGVFWAVTNMLRSRSGKTLDRVKSSKGKKQLIAAVTPGHIARLLPASQAVPGVLETVKFEDRIKKQRQVFYEPEKIERLLTLKDINTEGLTDEEKTRALALTQECFNFMLKGNTERVFLEEGIPLTIAIEDKVVTAGVKGIGALAIYEKLHKITDLKTQIAKLRELKEYQELVNYLNDLVSQVTPIQVDVLRNYFDSEWNQTTNEANEDRIYTTGFRDGANSRPKTADMSKLFIIGGIAIGIAGMVGGAVLAYLGMSGGSSA